MARSPTLAAIVDANPADDRDLEVLTEQECLQLLASHSVGRIAVSIPNDGPLVVPVNYTVGHGVILFRSAYGTKLRALPSRPVSFQVDDVDSVGRTGWSILVRGRAQEIHSRNADGPLPDPWVPDDKPYLVRLKIRAITGRRVRRRTPLGAHARTPTG